MSDFDREAERERLREKYERDQAKREASERMSELLLQGATMTNRHCPECQSPVFRYDGQQFCPTCQREVTEDPEEADARATAHGDDAAGAAGETGDASGAAGDGTAGAAVDDGTAGAAVDDGTAGTAGDRTAGAAADGTDRRESGSREEQPSRSGPRSEPDGTDPRGAGDRPETAERGTQPAPADGRRPARVDPPARRSGTPGGRGSAGGESGRGTAAPGDLGEAEAALRAEIASLTRRAGETADVGRKRDLLAAAREAAETLEAVRRLSDRR